MTPFRTRALRRVAKILPLVLSTAMERPLRFARS